MSPARRGFDQVRDGRLELLLRPPARAALEPLLRGWASGRLPTDGRPLRGGRGGAMAVELAPGLRVVLRAYRRGGLPARINRDLYFGLSPRPFAEARAAEHLREHGVPTAEVLGAAVQWVVPGCYRAALVTREVEGAVNLWEYLRSAAPVRRVAACRQAAEVARRMHDAGAVHPDLNLQNFLVRIRAPEGSGAGTGERENGEVEVWIIDLDRVRLRPVTDADRGAAVERICRSIRKLDPIAEVLTFDCVEAFGAIRART